MKLNLAEIKNTLNPYWSEKLEKCIEQINFASTFPETLCEEFLPYEELKNELLIAHEAVRELVLQLETVTTYVKIMEGDEVV